MGKRAAITLCMCVWVGLGGCSEDDSGMSGQKEKDNGGFDNAGAGTTAGGFDNGDNIAEPTLPEPEILGGGDCTPGHYVGSFKGMYNSAAWGNGSAPLTVEAVESMGNPGLEFWLEKTGQECAPDAEFCGDFTVKGGKIRGFANPFSDPNMPAAGTGGTNPFAIAVRFEIDLAGELDCATGKFMGLLQNGCYDVATVLYRFEGTMPGSYDKSTATFNDGEWTVKEMPMAGSIFPPDANIGGMGTWTAKLQDDTTSPVAAGMGLCD
jgi:hypothetical protein